MAFPKVRTQELQGPDGTTPQAFTVVPQRSFSQTLAGKMIPVADQLRDLLTVVGLRNYILRLVWTQWSEGERGFGVEEVFCEKMILPTPKIEGIESLDEVVNPVGVEEAGVIKVSQISGRYSENFLRGFGPNGEPVPENQQFFYEIEFPSENGTFPGIKRRFSIKGAPVYKPGKFGWEVQLDKSIANRQPDGTPDGL